MSSVKSAMKDYITVSVAFVHADVMVSGLVRESGSQRKYLILKARV
jgi:hypothetical protein